MPADDGLEKSATLLIALGEDHAAEVLKHLGPREVQKLGHAMAALKTVPRTSVETVLDEFLKRTAMGGVRTVAEILNFIGTGNETSVVDAIREYDPDLAQKILDEMFVFENLMEIDDRSIQMIMREVQSDSLVLALKGASPELREKIFKNMSQRAAEMLREDLESKGPVRLSEVEAEQKEILKIVRRLADEGQIVLGGAGGEQMV
jgi:flagellar motor switch protein FliG